MRRWDGYTSVVGEYMRGQVKGTERGWKRASAGRGEGEWKGVLASRRVEARDDGVGRKVRPPLAKQPTATQPGAPPRVKRHATIPKLDLTLVADTLSERLIGRNPVEVVRVGKEGPRLHARLQLLRTIGTDDRGVDVVERRVVLPLDAPAHARVRHGEDLRVARVLCPREVVWRGERVDEAGDELRRT